MQSAPSAKSSSSQSWTASAAPTQPQPRKRKIESCALLNWRTSCTGCATRHSRPRPSVRFSTCQNFSRADVSWLKRSKPQAPLEDQLLAQWRRSRRQVELELLPMRLLQSYLSRSSEETEGASDARTDLCPDRPRPLRRIARKMLSANAGTAKSALNWLNRRRCLQPLRVRLVQLRRRLVLKGLSLSLRSLRQYLGKRTCSKSSQTNWWTQQSKSG